MPHPFDNLVMWGCEVKTVIEAEISLSEICNMKPPVPVEIQVRLWLNSKGFKFLDDGKPSLIVNTSPIPAGVLYKDENFVSGSIRFKQVLNT